jgi:hypothetical protein
LAPGQYAVVGPHRNTATGPDNITTIGTTAAAPYAQEIRLGDLAATLGAGGRRPVVVSSNVGNANSYPKDPNTSWGFDIEALALAQRLGYKIGIVPARWLNDDRSHVKLSDYLHVLGDTFTVRRNLLSKKYRL